MKFVLERLLRDSLIHKDLNYSGKKLVKEKKGLKQIRVHIIVPHMDQ